MLDREQIENWDTAKPKPNKIPAPSENVGKCYKPLDAEPRKSVFNRLINWLFG